MKYLQDFDFNGKKVVMRVDFNVPQDDNGNVKDDTRIVAALPSIRHILEHGCRQLILMSHLGRPKSPEDKQFAMDQVAEKLASHLGESVSKVDDCIGDVPEDHRIVMLENLRFHPEEVNNDPEFGAKLVHGADIYVCDAFGNSHRAHSSMVGIPQHIPGCAGLLIQKELEMLDVHNVERPFTAIIGGAKLETKIPLIEHLVEKVDMLLLGGGMIFTFLAAQDKRIGKSMVDLDSIDFAKKLLADHGDKIFVPVDVVIGSEVSANSEAGIVSVNDIPEDKMGLDIGPETCRIFEEKVNQSKTIVWNGPMGVFEIDKFAQGTHNIAKIIASMTDHARTVVGGGDSISAVDEMGLGEAYTHVSTGGGASLELLEGKELPAIKALQENAQKFGQ